jgi:hypothetical protein
MKNTLLITTLTASLVLAAGCGRSTRTDTAATDTTTYPTTTTPTTTTEPTYGSQIDQAASRTSGAIADAGRSAADATRDAARDTGDAMRRAGDAMSAEMREWRLSAQDLEADLRADREIVRTKSSAGAPTGNVDKSALKSNVESNVKSQATGINDLDVEIDRETEVVLTGDAQSVEQVSQAMGAALSTEGVTKVTSKIKLKK